MTKEQAKEILKKAAELEKDHPPLAGRLQRSSGENVRPNGAPTYDASGHEGTDDSSWTNYQAYFEHNKRWATEGPYVTKLTPEEENRFKAWVDKNQVPWRDAPDADYDMRGYWKAMIGGNPLAVQGENKHFPDRWKTPYDSTFSQESIYATPGAPVWRGNDLVESGGKK